ncbi:MAG: AMP-binding protein, partial [Clostridiales bacterium]|nr:AMP-binding protein [Clostridiales bacterium]
MDGMDGLHFTPAQTAIAHLQEMYPESGICNIGGSIRLGRHYEEETLREALTTLLYQNPAMALRLNGQGKPYLGEAEMEPYPWKGEAEPTQEELSQWLMLPFGEKNCLLCEFMYWQAADGTVLYGKVHHLLLDSYGITLCMNRLLILLENKENRIPEKEKEEPVGAAAEAEADSRFIEMMEAEHPVSGRALEWFRRQAASEEIGIQKRKTVRYGEVDGIRQRFQIPETLFRRMRQAEAEWRISLEVQFAAALSIYFARVSGCDCYVFGRSLLNRRKADMDLPGMMANTLPVIVHLTDVPDFRELCRQIKEYFYGMMRYADLDQEVLRQELGATGPLYDVMLTFRRQKFIPFIGDIEQKEIFNPLLELPMRIYLDELPEEMRVDFHYQTACYQEAEIEAIYARLLCVLEQGLSESKLKDISVLSENDQKLWDRVNATEHPLPAETTLQKINCIVEKAGEKTALCYRETHLTYKEMLDQAERVAAFLLKQGVHDGSIVGVCLDRPLDIPCVFLGIWKAGAAFLPVSIRENEERVREIRQMCDYFWDEEVSLNELPALPEQIAFPGDIRDNAMDLPAYYMFTSGSTGKAKAAVISHLSLACRLSWMEEKWYCADSVLQKAAYTFDVSVWEYFLPLSNGGCLYLLKDEEKRSPEVILSTLACRRIRTVHFVPSLLSVWLEYAQKRTISLPHLEHVFSSGEALSPELAEQFYRQFPHVSLHNLYGPTECTIDVTGYDCKKGDKTIPIGTPAFWTGVEILDEEKRCLPPGIEGELSIRGTLVGEGYYHYESDRFRFGEQCEKIVDTGDRALLGFDGQIYYLGRRDGQRKINGMRVDLEQIESVMRMVPGVQRAAVLCVKNRLVGFYMAAHPVKEIEMCLAEKLPYYSIPSKLVFCEKMPLTPNGKIDRSHLLERIPAIHTEAPKNKREEILLGLIEKELGAPVDPEENLFLAGLDSLTVMSLALKAEEKGIHLTTMDFYEKRTVRSLAALEEPGCHWLNRQNGRQLVLAFPYAAGSPEDFAPLAQLLKQWEIDFCVAADAGKIPDTDCYEDVVLLGYCTGTAEALQSAGILERRGKKPDGMLLCASIPPSEKEARHGSPWRRMSDRMVRQILNYLHGGTVRLDADTIRLFRRDTDRYFHYFQKPVCRSDVNTVVLLGERDLLTFPANYRQSQWTKYLSGKIRCRVLPKRGHFFLNHSSRLIAGEIRR